MDLPVASFCDVKRYIFVSALCGGSLLAWVRVSFVCQVLSLPGVICQGSVFSAKWPCCRCSPSAAGTDRCVHTAPPHWPAGPGPSSSFPFVLGSVKQRATFTLVVCSRNSFVPFLFRGRGENSGRFPKNPQP